MLATCDQGDTDDSFILDQVPEESGENDSSGSDDSFEYSDDNKVGFILHVHNVIVIHWSIIGCANSG